MRLFSIILLVTTIVACTDSTGSSEEQVDTVTDSVTDVKTETTDAAPPAADLTSTSEDALVLDTVVVEPTTDVTEGE